MSEPGGDGAPRPSVESAAVLLSGGLDSAVLFAETVRAHRVVYPLYIRSGLLWEEAEIAHLRQFLAALRRVAPTALQILECPVADLYGEHWSVSGRDVPDDQSADEAVFLPGRNLFLLAKPMMWCHVHEVPLLALGVLASNPFPDATDEFFVACQRVINTAVGGRVRVERPFATLSKTEVVHRGRGLPLEKTFSCLRPVGNRHCGHCNKCAERQRAFAEADVADATVYDQPAKNSNSAPRRRAPADV